MTYISERHVGEQFREYADVNARNSDAFESATLASESCRSRWLPMWTTASRSARDRQFHSDPDINIGIEVNLCREFVSMPSN